MPESVLEPCHHGDAPTNENNNHNDLLKVELACEVFLGSLDDIPEERSLFVSVVPRDTPADLKVFILGKNVYVSTVAEVDENGESVILLFLKASELPPPAAETNIRITDNPTTVETSPIDSNNDIDAMLWSILTRDPQGLEKPLAHLEAEIQIVDDTEGMVKDIPRLVLDENVFKLLSSLKPGFDIEQQHCYDDNDEDDSSPGPILNEMVRRKIGRVIRAHRGDKESDVELTLVRRKIARVLKPYNHDDEEEKDIELKLAKSSSFDSIIMTSNSAASTNRRCFEKPSCDMTEVSTASSASQEPEQQQRIRFLFCMRSRDMVLEKSVLSDDSSIMEDSMLGDNDDEDEDEDKDIEEEQEPPTLNDNPVAQIILRELSARRLDEEDDQERHERHDDIDLLDLD